MFLFIVEILNDMNGLETNLCKERKVRLHMEGRTNLYKEGRKSNLHTERKTKR